MHFDYIAAQYFVNGSFVPKICAKYPMVFNGKLEVNFDGFELHYRTVCGSIFIKSFANKHSFRLSNYCKYFQCIFGIYPESLLKTKLQTYFQSQFLNPEDF